MSQVKSSYHKKCHSLLSVAFCFNLVMKLGSSGKRKDREHKEPSSQRSPPLCRLCENDEILQWISAEGTRK